MLPERPTPKRHRRFLSWVVLALILAILIVLAPLGYGLARAGSGAWQLREDLRTLQAALLVRDFDGALLGVEHAEKSLTSMRAGLRATGAWKFFPIIGARIQALEAVGRSGASALEAARDLLVAAKAIQDALDAAGVLSEAGSGIAPNRSFSDLTVDERREVLARIYDVLPALRLAREKVAIAYTAWQQVPQDDLIGPVKQALEPLAASLPTLKRQLDEVTEIAEIILPLAGYPTPKNFLVLLQNAEELRPTGGFIGTVGELEVNNGSILRFQFDDVYNVDGPATDRWKVEPPELMKRELGVASLYLRDVNWSPDFPTTAALAMQFYEGERALGGITSDVSGVIAIQPGFFEDLLRLTGPLTIDGKQFDADHFFDELEYDVEIGFREDGTPLRQRKEVVAKVGQTLLEKVFSLPSERWPALLDLAVRSLDQKDILLFDPDPAVLPLLDAHGWTGRMGASEGRDFLAVVDANLAALKTDGVMKKQIIYSVDARDPNQAIATVRLRYTNTNRKIDWRYTRYRSYTRIYVPEGSEFLGVEGARGEADVSQELGKRVLGAFWVIEPGQTRDLVFRYRLPASALASVAEGTYQLLVQKQPGANTSLTLDHAFGKNIQSASPPEAAKDFGDQRYRATQELTEDVDVEVKFSN